MMFVDRRIGRLAAAVFFLLALAGAATAQKWQAAFEEAVKHNDYEATKQVVAGDRVSALQTAMEVYEVDFCQASLKGEKEKAAAALAYIKEIGRHFKIEFKGSQLIERRAKWVESLDDGGKQGRIDVYAAWQKAWQVYDAARSSGTEDDHKIAVASINECAAKAIAIKDTYHTAGALEIASHSYQGLADTFAIVYSLKKAIDLGVKPGQLEFEFPAVMTRFDEWAKKDVKKPELVDITIDLEASRAKYQKDFEESQIIRGAALDPKTGKGSVLVPPRTNDAFDWLEESGFKPIAPYDIYAKPTPWYSLNSFPEQPIVDIFSTYFHLEKDQKHADFAPVPNSKVYFDGKLQLDPDGDGKAAAIEIKVKPKAELQKFDVKYDDNSTQKLAMFLTQRPGNFSIFGKQFSSSDAHKVLNFTVTGASAIAGKLRGHNVVFLDAFPNGAFDDAGYDVVIIDAGTKNERIEPIGRYIYLDQGSGSYPYEIKVVTKNGGTIRTRPYDTKKELVPLSVEWKSAKGSPKFLLAKGSGEDEAFYFNLMAATKAPLWVPPGSYSIFRGYMVFGSDARKDGFVCVAKGRSGGFKVESGKQAVWKVGGAGEKGFWCTTDVVRNPDEATTIDVLTARLQGDKTEVFIRYYGCEGEEYFNFYPNRVFPSIEVRKNDGNGPIVAKGEMKCEEDTYGLLWFPSKFSIKNVAKSEKVVVKLRANHDFLGKIESDWIAIKE